MADSGPSRTGNNSFSVIRVGKSVVITPKTPLSLEVAGDFRKLSEDLIANGETAVVMDCKYMSFIDSEGLETLLDAQGNLTGRGGVLKLANLNSVCKDILVVTRLINVFHVYNDIPEAIKSRL